MKRLLRYIAASILFLAGFALEGNAQFKEGAFTQTYNDEADTTGVRDTSDKLFSFKEFFGGLAHKNQMKIGTMFAGSIVLPGTAQIYNKQYWKLPIIYGGIGALAGTGGYYLHKYNQSGGTDIQAKTTGTCLLLGAGFQIQMGKSCFGNEPDGVKKASVLFPDGGFHIISRIDREIHR